MVSFTPQPLYPIWRNAVTCSIRGSVRNAWRTNISTYILYCRNSSASIACMCLSLFLETYGEVHVTQNDQPQPSLASERVLHLCCLSLPHRKFLRHFFNAIRGCRFRKETVFCSLGLPHPLKAVTCTHETVVAPSLFDSNAHDIESKHGRRISRLNMIATRRRVI